MGDCEVAEDDNDGELEERMEETERGELESMGVGGRTGYNSTTLTFDDVDSVLVEEIGVDCEL